jgi:hypothetical protein
MANNETINFNVGVSARTTDAALHYLRDCGVYEEPSLVLYDGFVEDMLVTTLADSRAVQPPVTEHMKERAIEYFSLYFDPENPTVITDPKFVHGLLTYAILGQSVYSPPKVARPPLPDSKNRH